MDHMANWLGSFSYSSEDVTLMILFICQGSGETIRQEQRQGRGLREKRGKVFKLSEMVTGIRVGQTSERNAMHNVWGLARGAGMNPARVRMRGARTGGVKE